MMRVMPRLNSPMPAIDDDVIGDHGVGNGREYARTMRSRATRWISHIYYQVAEDIHMAYPSVIVIAFPGIDSGATIAVTGSHNIVNVVTDSLIKTGCGSADCKTDSTRVSTGDVETNDA